MWKLDSDCTDAIALCSAARPFTSPNIFLFFSPSCPCSIDQVKLTGASELEDIDFPRQICLRSLRVRKPTITLCRRATY